MEELVAYDPHLVVGILGGGAGTTYDAFKLIAEAQKYGARVALYGRKINNAENQLAFVEFLRLIVDGQIGPEEAVRAYHGVLERLKIKPLRKLEADLQLRTNVMSYNARGSVSVPAAMPAEKPTVKSEDSSTAPKAGCGCKGGAASEKPKTTEPKHDDSHPCSCGCSGKTEAKSTAPDVTKMTQAEKLAYNKAKRDRIFG